MAAIPVGPVNSKALIALSQRDPVFAKALKLVTKLHDGRKRKHTGLKYVSHPMTVASVLLEFTTHGATLIAAALQDTLALTNLKESTLREEYGDEVADMVVALTPSKNADGSLDKEAYLVKLASAEPNVMDIKLASLLDHICAIPAKKLSVEQGFLAECAELLPALNLGNEELYRRVHAAIRRARK